MTEISRPWGGTATGDKGPYSFDQWADIYAALFGRKGANKGVLYQVDNELAVTGVASPVSVDTGGAMVDGSFYDNSVAVTVTIPTPSSSTRIDRIVLRKDWTAQAVRVTRIAGSEGGGAPAMTQTDGVTWDIPLAQVSINTGGTITVTDEREYISGFPTNFIGYTTDAAAPAGFTIYAAAQGRAIVGTPSGGTDEGTVGSALTDLQDKIHTHGSTGHNHSYNYTNSHTSGGCSNDCGGSVGSTNTDSGNAALSDVFSYVQLTPIKKD